MPLKKTNTFGNIILFKVERFIAINFSTIDYHKIAKKILDLPAVMRSFCGLQIELYDRQTKKELIVCCIHLEWNPVYSDIKNLQAYVLMNVLNESSNNNSKPVLLCGDFNSDPSSAVYHGITTGKSSNVFDEKTKPIIRTPKIFTDSPYKSCYKTILKREPKYTTYTVDFKEVLDLSLIHI